MDEAEILSLIERRHRQLLLHSFLYYKMATNLITDTTYDHLCKELVDLRERYPEIVERAVYSDVCRGFDSSGSGFFLTDSDYPPEVISVAARFAYTKSGRRVPFEDFLKEHNLRLLDEPKPKAKRTKQSKA